jgi:hypothetical protein
VIDMSDDRDVPQIVTTREVGSFRHSSGG